MQEKNDEIYPKIRDTPQCDNLILLGVTLQSDCKFNKRMKCKLMKANKCLYILRIMRKEQYNQTEIDHLFRSLVLPNITYGSPFMALLNQTLRLYSVFWIDVTNLIISHFRSEYMSHYKSRTQKFLTQSPSLMIIPLL